MADHGQNFGIPARPGSALRALRNQRGWTLADVSQRTGLTVSALSKIENDKVALTLEKLIRLSKGLEVDIAQLVGLPTGQTATNLPTPGASRRSINRAGDGRVISMPRGNYHYLASDLLQKRMIPIYGEVFARSIEHEGQYLHHEGEEFVFVLEGTLDLHTDTYAPIRLEQGDSIYFDSAMAHAYIRVGEAPCRILSICASSEAQVRAPFEEAAAASAPAPAPDAAEPPRVRKTPAAKAKAVKAAVRKPAAKTPRKGA